MRKLDDDIPPKLKARAAKHGRSLEEHLRLVLRAEADRLDEPEVSEPQVGIGTAIANLFKDCGFEPGEFEPDGIMGSEPMRAAVFDD